MNPEELKQEILTQVGRLLGDGDTFLNDYQGILESVMALLSLALAGSSKTEVATLLEELGRLRELYEALYQANGNIEWVADAAAAVF